MEKNNIEKKKFSKKVKIAIIAAVVLLGGASVYAVSEYDDIVELQRAATQLPAAEGQPEQPETVEAQPDAQQSDEASAQSQPQDQNQAQAQNQSQAPVQNQASSVDIGLEKARSIALAEVPGAADSDILAAYSDYDDGRLEYDVTILYDGYEYEFELDGTDGKILSKDVERMERGYSDYY